MKNPKCCWSCDWYKPKNDNDDWEGTCNLAEKHVVENALLGQDWCPLVEECDVPEFNS